MVKFVKFSYGNTALLLRSIILMDILQSTCNFFQLVFIMSFMGKKLSSSKVRDLFRHESPCCHQSNLHPVSVHLLHFCSQHLLLHSFPDPSGLDATNKVRESFPPCPYLLRIFPPELKIHLWKILSLIAKNNRRRAPPHFPVCYHRRSWGAKRTILVAREPSDGTDFPARALS